MFTIKLDNQFALTTIATVVIENNALVLSGQTVIDLAVVKEVEITSDHDYGFVVTIDSEDATDNYIHVTEVHVNYDGKNTAIESDYFSTGFSLIDLKKAKRFVACNMADHQKVDRDDGMRMHHRLNRDG